MNKTNGIALVFQKNQTIFIKTSRLIDEQIKKQLLRTGNFNLEETHIRLRAMRCQQISEGITEEEVLDVIYIAASC